MLHFQQLSSGIKSQLTEMIEEKAKLKRGAKDDADECDATAGATAEAKRPKSAGGDHPKGEGEGADEQSKDAARELVKEQSLSPFNTTDATVTHAKTISQVFSSNNQAPVTAADINRMNRERGLEIVSMAGRYEALVDSASRSPAANMERNKIWHQITDAINKKYSHLNMLTFEQCKKLCKYYKRKDPAAYGITLNTVSEDPGEAKDGTGFDGHFDEPIDDNEILEANDIVDEICKEAIANKASEKKLPEEAPPDEEIVREIDQPSSDLLEFLAQCSASTSAASTDGLIGVQAPITNQQKKERGQYVCKMAETFGTIFESHSRSYQVNAERNQVWKQIADMTNEKYAAELGDLTVEQTKKIYANYKRKCQQMSSRSGSKFGGSEEDTRRAASLNGSNADVDSDASSSSDLLTRLITMPQNGGVSSRSSNSPGSLPKLASRERPHASGRGDVKNGLTPRGPNSILSTVELLAMLADRDAEIKQLKNELLQKSVEHQLQISRVIEKMSDLVKTAVSANVQREIMSAMGGSSYTFGDGFSEKAFDDDNDL